MKNPYMANTEYVVADTESVTPYFLSFNSYCYKIATYNATDTQLWPKTSIYMMAF